MPNLFIQFPRREFTFMCEHSIENSIITLPYLLCTVLSSTATMYAGFVTTSKNDKNKQRRLDYRTTATNNQQPYSIKIERFNLLHLFFNLHRYLRYVLLTVIVKATTVDATSINRLHSVYKALNQKTRNRILFPFPLRKIAFAQNII